MSRCIALALLLTSAALHVSAAQTATTTALQLSAASVVASAPVTLTASVTAGKPVAPGLVYFCNASATSCQGPGLLGSAQLVSTGTASMVLTPGIGTHSIKAVFSGTKAFAGSTSTTEIVSVTGTLSTSTTISASGNPGNYTLAATVSAGGAAAPTGDVFFEDVTSGAILPGGLLGKGPTNRSFTPVASSNAGNEPVAQAVGDFNNDGKPDLVIANMNSSMITVLLGNGDGTFTPTGQALYTGAFPSAIAVADFNNDGKQDIAIACSSDSVTIFLGQGDGTFQAGPAPPATQVGPISIVAGDFNQDGNADLAIANQASSTVTILLGDGHGNFSNAPGTPPPTGYFPTAVAIGDFNNDGKQDLAIANQYANTVTILLGNGDGTFSAGASPATGVYPNAVVVGDFNADGHQDLALTNGFSKTVTVLLGDGKGNFTPVSETLATGENPDSVALGDLNGDGIEDLVVASWQSNNVTVFLGHGDGTFPAAQAMTIGAGTTPHSAALADFDGDGTTDIVVTDSNANQLTVLLNIVNTVATAVLTDVSFPGGGTHEVGASYPSNANYSRSVSGLIALMGALIPTKVALAVQPTTTAGVGETIQLTATVSAAAMGAISPTGNIVFYNGATQVGTGTVLGGLAVFNLTLTTAGTESFSAKYSGDLNFSGSSSGASQLTVIAPSASTTTLAVSSNSVTVGTIVTLTASVSSGGKPVTQGTVLFCNLYSFCDDSEVLGIAHLNANGVAAIKVTLPYGINTVEAYFSGTAEIQKSAFYNVEVTVTVPALWPTGTILTVTGTPGNYILSANVAGGAFPSPNGFVTFVDTTNQNHVLGTTHVFASQPTFGVSTPAIATAKPYTVVAADFNGDGKPDLAAAGLQSGTLSVLLGNGDGTFTAKPSSITVGPTYSLASGDFNGDGKTDLAVAELNANSVDILLGIGDGTFTKKITVAVGSAPSYVAVGDFNNDGILDLAVANSQSATLTILLGKGDGTFTTEIETPVTGLRPTALALADFNKDGKLDIVIASEAGLVFAFGNGDGTFSQGPQLTTLRPQYLVVGDFNRDGSPDLALTDYNDSTVSILLNDGHGNLSLVTTMPVGSMPAGIVACDLNGDHNTDLAVATQSGNLTILTGNGNGTFNSKTLPTGIGAQLWGIAAADLDGNGGPDLVMTETNGSYLWTMFTGTAGTATLSGVTIPDTLSTHTHQIQAIYQGNRPYAGSTSATVGLVATP